MTRHAILLAALLAVAPLAGAADNGFYLGAGYAQSEYDLENPLDAQPFDDEDGGFKVIAGLRLLDSFAVEASYTDHGNVSVPPSGCPVEMLCTDQFEGGAETISAFAVGFLDFPVIDLFAKVGGASWQFDGSGGAGARIDESDFDFAWGAGVQAHFGSLAARLEYERFKVVDDRDIGTISLSFLYTFL